MTQWASLAVALSGAAPWHKAGAALAEKALGRATGLQAKDFQTLLHSGVAALERLAERAAPPGRPSASSLRQAAQWLATVDVNRDSVLSRAELDTSANQGDPLAKTLLARYEAIAAADGQGNTLSLADLAAKAP